MPIAITLSSSDLASIRLAHDAVWETAASLNAICFPRHHAIHQRLRTTLPRSPSFDLKLLLELTSQPHWIPDILGPEPSARPTDPRDRLSEVRETSPDVARRDLEVLLRYRPDSSALGMSTDEFMDSVTRALLGYWEEVLAPLWERVDAIIDAEIQHYSKVIGSHGVAMALTHLHEDVRFENDSLHVLVSGADVARDAGGHGIWLVPSVFRWPWLAIDTSRRAPVISYAARGSALVWETRSGQPLGLGALLGRSRAAVLESLEVPRSTTGLAQLLSLSPPTVSGHLSVLAASGLVTSRRQVRRVMYARTPMAEQLLKVQTKPVSDGRRAAAGQEVGQWSRVTGADAG